MERVLRIECELLSHIHLSPRHVITTSHMSKTKIFKLDVQVNTASDRANLIDFFAVDPPKIGGYRIY